MKQYHTQIDIAAPPSTVWRHLTDFAAYPAWNPLVGRISGDFRPGGRIATEILPLGKTYAATLLQWEPGCGLTWQGVQGARFLLAGRHYYHLEPLPNGHTRLKHGEYFTGWLSAFIPGRLLAKMQDAFTRHNHQLQQRIHDEN
jgi:hypothetical protein